MTTGAPAEPQGFAEDTLARLQSLKLPYNPEINRFAAGFSPTPALAAIILAGTHLRYKPSESLITDPAVLSDEQQADFSINTLATILNATRTRPKVDADTPAFVCVEPETRDLCSESERYFLTVASQLATSPTPHATVVAHNGEPVLLRKHQGARTALALCDITIDEVPYPAGSITRAVISDEAEHTKSSVFDVADVTSLGFLRLSAFAPPLDQRTAWEGEYVEGSRIILGTSIDSMRESIRQRL